MTIPDIYTDEESSVAALLAKRNELDIRIRKEHTRKLTIFFCDIKGYTAYTEMHGDLASRALCEQMNDIAFPALEEFDGYLVKTIGDAIMASFNVPEQAVRFAIALLRRLKVDNESRPAINHVTIRIGMHYGEAIVDAGDLFGDSVNIAARIEPQAKPNGILISSSLFHEVRNIQDVVCVYAKEVMMKGKSEAIKLYQVVWDGDRQDDYSEAEQKQGASKELRRGAPQQPGKKWSSTTILTAVFAAVFSVVVLKTVYQKQIFSGPKTSHNKVVMSVVDPYLDGYTALRKGEMAAAVNHFEKISATDPAYLETRAALSYWQNDFDAARGFVTEALNQGGDRIFPHVLDGNLKLRKALLDQAFVAYQQGSVQEKGVQWQKARAFNGLARILAARGEEERALSHYQKAVGLESDDAEILTNQGVLLEKLGKAQEALAVYQHAVKVNPDNELARQRLQLSLKREKIKSDKEQQDRINTLVAELSAQYKKDDAAKIEEQTASDQLTLPLSAWLVGFDEKGDMPKQEGENDVFIDLLTQGLLNAGSVELVERALLDNLLAELKLGSSDLANQKTSLRLGRLLAAKILITGSIYRRAGETMINVKVIETETSRIRATATVMLAKGEGLFSSASALANEITQKIESVYF